ncbi:hypothetical protein F2Q70_00021970 [Brassica cretica]|uniref:Uncharacterized protein n=1 Tax=Brassica cretica TaxID=69181 RepID=A0A8S9GKN6_BRACR|nr:hypothetical protein F2Q70_00021970 [Brassica cretica]
MLSLVTQACEPSGDNKVMGHCPDLPGLVRQIWSSARFGEADLEFGPIHFSSSLRHHEVVPSVRVRTRNLGAGRNPSLPLDHDVPDKWLRMNIFSSCANISADVVAMQALPLCVYNDN